MGDSLLVSQRLDRINTVIPLRNVRLYEKKIEERKHTCLHKYSLSKI